MEKKEIKISLGTFVVVVVGIALLYLSVCLGAYVINANKMPTGNENELITLSEAEALLNQMFNVAGELYSGSTKYFKLSDTVENGYYREVLNYNEVLNRYFTQFNKYIYDEYMIWEREDGESWPKKSLFVKNKGKIYMSQREENSNKYWKNAQFYDVSIQENKIKAKLYADIYTYEKEKKDELYKSNAECNFVLVKENNIWKIQEYKRAEMYNELEIPNISEFPLGTYKLMIYPNEYDAREPEMYDWYETITFYDDYTFEAYKGWNISIYGDYSISEDGILTCNVRKDGITGEESNEIVGTAVIKFKIYPYYTSAIEVIESSEYYTGRILDLDENGDYYSTNKTKLYGLYPFQTSAVFMLMHEE